MKQLIQSKASLFLISLSLALFSFKPIPNSVPLKTKHVDATITSTSGCTLHIVGDVHYTLIPLAITWFTGTVTMSGTCSGTLTFNKSVSVSANITSEETNISTITWSGDAQAKKVLSEEDVDRSVKLLFENAVRSDINP